MSPPESVSFGAQSIAASQKPQRIESLFDNIAHKYDLMNDLMSLGLHRLWKHHLLLNLSPQPQHTLWDAAGGTADVAIRFLQKGGKHATITDLSAEMLEVGKQRAIQKNLLGKTTFLQDDMENSALPTQHFHAVTCAWGLRNTTHIDKALQEMHRCLRFGGNILILEFAPQPAPQIRALHNAWCEHAVPKLGKYIAQSEESYRYLIESIQRFLTPIELNNRLKDAGFAKTTMQPLGARTAALHKGWKL